MYFSFSAVLGMEEAGPCTCQTRTLCCGLSIESATLKPEGRVVFLPSRPTCDGGDLAHGDGGGLLQVHLDLLGLLENGEKAAFSRAKQMLLELGNSYGKRPATLSSITPHLCVLAAGQALKG